MSTQVAGNINQYIDLVGRSDATIKTEVQRIAETLKCTPVIFEFDQDSIGYDSTKSSWLLHEVGLEFKWLNGELEAVALYTKDHLVSDFMSHPTPLFNNFSNTATRDEIIQRLGRPAAEGKWKQSWIRYDNPNNTWINFEFDDALQLRMVMVCTP
jgi:hypothetical protein